MSLTSGKGPLGRERAGRFSAPVPEGVAYVEPHPRRIQALLDDRFVIDTEHALLGAPRRAAPWPTRSRPTRSATSRHPSPPGPATSQVRWDAATRGSRRAGSWSTTRPTPTTGSTADRHRRHLRVEVAGTTLVDTDDTVILFETALDAEALRPPARHVRTDLLRRTPTTSYCNYKGHATYWAAVVGDTIVDDVAWSYEEPLPESS